mmetsp:Transcript_7349/g.22637  ORF Transcript_7349/g.22637 Transcript_7349/m.22637 type:complete len:109 (-) Transcript_7349:475-801(-)
MSTQESTEEVRQEECREKATTMMGTAAGREDNVATAAVTSSGTKRRGGIFRPTTDERPTRRVTKTNNHPRQLKAKEATRRCRSRSRGRCRRCRRTGPTGSPAGRRRGR